MNVIIGEGLADEAYVRDYTVGYDELAERVGRYTPEWASEQTGIPADDIRTLAREYATSQPSMIRIGVAIERHAGGGQTVRSIACLPALVGAWRQVGGGLLQLPLWAFPVNWPALLHPELATPGTRVVNQFLLGRALTGELGLDPPVTALMVYNSQPGGGLPGTGQGDRGLSRDRAGRCYQDRAGPPSAWCCTRTIATESGFGDIRRSVSRQWCTAGGPERPWPGPEVRRYRLGLGV